MNEELALLPGFLTAHLRLTLLALAAGVLLSVPAGVWAARRPRAGRWVLGIVGVAQTIPGLALLAVMVPALAYLGMPSIGFLPAILALTVYSLLPILRNTVAGLAGVDAAVLEAARAVGMTPGQRLRAVELPLALPVIVAGLRTATVWVVGTATLATPVGATSLGNFIFSGLQTRNFRSVLVGCVAAAALAMLLDGLIRALETGLAERRRGLVGLAAAGLAALALWATASLVTGAGSGAGRERIAVGAKTFTEQYILAELLAAKIESATDLGARTVPSLGSTVAFDALANDQIDVYVEYTGTLWATVMKRESTGMAAAEVLEGVRSYLAAEHGVVLAAALGFENAYALAMPRTLAAELGVTTIGDLARVADRLVFGGDYEFFRRAEWRELVAAYGLEPRERRTMDPALMYQAAAGGEVDVISAFSTDGRVAALDLVLLEDDRNVIPPYDAVVLVGPAAAQRHPQLVAALAALEGTIDRERMQRANLAVDRDGATPKAIATELAAETAGSN